MAIAMSGQTRKVYILPMAGGFDQFLAEQLTREQRNAGGGRPADRRRVLTDRLGPAVREKAGEIHRDEDDDDAAETHPGFR